MTVRLAHQIQVTFYAMILERAFALLPLANGWTVAGGRVWTPQALAGIHESEALARGLIESHEVSLALVEPYIGEFFRESAVDLLREGSEPAWFMHEQACGGCQYREECTGEALEKSHINALPSISFANRRWLLGKAAAGRDDGRAELVDIEDIARLVEKPHAVSSVRERIDSVLKVSTSADDQSRSSPLVNVWQQRLKEGKKIVVPIVKPTRLLPPEEEVAVVVDLCIDPRTATAMAATVVECGREQDSAFVVHRKGWRKSSRGREETVEERRLSDVEVAELFVRELHRVVERNTGMRAQFYCESAEAKATIVQALVALSIDEAKSERSPSDGALEMSEKESENVKEREEGKESDSVRKRKRGRERELPIHEVAWRLLLVLSDDPSLLMTELTRDDMQSIGLTVTNMSIKVDQWREWLELYNIPAPVCGSGARGRVLKGDLKRAFLTGMLKRWGVAMEKEADDKQLADVYKKAVKDRMKEIARSPPRLVELMTVVGALLCMPVPAFYTFAECAGVLLGKDCSLLSLESVYQQLERDDCAPPHCCSLLLKRAEAIWASVECTRDIISESCRQRDRELSLTLTELPRKCSVDADRRLRHPHLRRLLFMCQYEVVVLLEQYRTERITGAATIVVRPISCQQEEPQSALVDFEIVSGQHLVAVEHEGGLGKSILFQSMGESQLSADVDYVDLRFSGTVAKNLRGSSRLSFCDIVDFSNSRLRSRLFGSEHFVKRHFRHSPDGPLSPSDPSLHFAIRPRLADFTTSKKLAALLDCDSSYLSAIASGPSVPLPLFLRLLADPNALSCLPPQSEPWREAAEAQARLYSRAAFLRLLPEKLNVRFDPSQEQAFAHTLSHRLQLVWGPPGTGKTYYLTRALLRMFLAARELGEQQATFRVVVTAYTNTAIVHLLNELAKLLRAYRAYESKTTGRELPVELVFLGREETEGEGGGLKMEESIRVGNPTAKATAEHWCLPLVVYGTTAWQLAKATAMGACDLLLVDEGSQLPLVDSLIAISRLNPLTGAMIVVGDHLQLPPIRKGDYPPARDEREPALYGSVLEGLMRDREGKRVTDALASLADSSSPALVKLTRNRRCNAAISAFLKSLYGRNYTAVGGGREEYLTVVSASDTIEADDEALGRILRVPLLSHWRRRVRVEDSLPLASLVTVVVSPPEREIVSEQERVVEGRVLGQILAELAEMAPRNLPRKAEEKDRQCFVITPHRTQRYFAKRLLPAHLLERCRIDTVERMQGQEAEVVVVSCCYFDSDVITKESDFVYHLRRLNVAFSRARKLVVFVVTPALLRPGPDVLASQQCREGYAHVLSFLRASARIDLSLSLAPSAASAPEDSVVSGDQWLLRRTDRMGGPD
eukprot:CAMPEP_0114607998 /NCGR_PEP_ID=MMETSP0168-20121206/2353_1 /TAXON_ID=95228 ORGANISM="Vannella sp., Strain DIVA3 517/6/12" /NCGR_SAMPLE_ID=MMETSP0168 /ASSEMBLY_ACC=CAM_ASM_000044 /LENGTH=1360 /DNA_ID=CAMNT_0001818885 /DNA_START=99 /DNA_END=4178 /DNA_ORIENTATION=+